MRRVTSFSFLSCTLILFLAGFVFSVSAPPPKTWTGAAMDGDWANSSNWVAASTPVFGDDVIITGSYLTITNITSISLNSLTINASVPITMQGVGFQTITLAGTLTLTSSLTIGNQLTIAAGGGGSVASGASLSLPGSTGGLNNGGVFTVNGTVEILGISAGGHVLGNALVYTSGSLLLYQYSAGVGFSPTGSELPTLPNVMDGNLTVNVPNSGYFFKMVGNVRVTGACNFIEGRWGLNGGTLQLDGAVTVAASNMEFLGIGSLVIDGSGTIAGSFDAVSSLSLADLTINRAGTSLTLVNGINVSNSLNLINGKINCATNNVVLNVTNPLPTAITGGNPNSYVITNSIGYLQRDIPNGTPGGDYLLPVGTATGYLGYAAVNPTFVTSGPAYIYAYAADVTPSAPIASSQVVYNRPSGMVTSVDAGIRLYSAQVLAASNVATSNAQLPLSSYSPLTNNSLLNGQFVESISVTFGAATQWLGITGPPTPPYVWAGAPGANWQTPSSWSPPRNNPAVTDELIFDVGTHTPTNIPHETVSQLTIRNGATVTFSASNPNNWLTTTAMPYGVIVESGGKLDLGAPATNIALYISPGSVCGVYGTLQTQNSAVIGAGGFSLSNDALLATTRDDGINGASVSGGAVQTASANYHPQARYEFTSASPGAERDMNFKQQGGRQAITQMRALYVGASSGTRRLNSSITVGGLPPLLALAFSKSVSSLQSASIPEVVIKGRTTLHSAFNSTLVLNNDIPLTIRNGAELWNNGQIIFSGASTVLVDNAFLTMVGPDGGGGAGTGTMSGGSSTTIYSGASMLSFTGGGTFTTTDFILPATMPVPVSVSNASVVSLNSSKTLQAGLQLSSAGKMALNNRSLTLNGLTTSSGGALRGATLSALTLNGTVSGGLVFESGFGSLNALALNYAQTPVPALSGTLDVLNTLTLQNGILTVAAPNTLTLSNSAPSSLSGGSSTSYISGALRRTMQAGVSADGQSYVFPVGDSTYRPFTLANVRTGTVQPTVLGQSFATGAGTWTPPLTSGAAYNWLAQTLLGDFLTATFQVGSAQSPIPAGLRIATAAAQVGGYGDIGSDDVSPVRSSLPQAATASASGTYFALGGAVPSILSFTPRVARPGQTVTLIGQFLSSATGVSFGGVPAANFTVVSPTQITAVVGNSGASGGVQVQSPLGTVVAPLPFTWTGQPTITSIAPSLNVVGQTITIRGTEYHPTPSVSIGTQLASSVTAASLTELRVVFAQATTGVLNIIASGGTVSWQQPLTVYASPTLTSLSTTQPLPGTLFTVLGTNFVQGQTQVSIGNVSVQATVNSPTQMTLIAPQSANGTLQITTPAGTVLSSTAIVIIPPPSIASALPNEPQVGDVIALVGTNYVNVQTVSIGGIPTTFTVNSPTSISAIAPPFSAASPTSSATVSVTTRSGTAVYSRPLTLRQPPEPVMTLTSFAPQSAIEGQSVMVTGLNVPENALVRLQSAFASVNAIAHIQLANNISTMTFNAPVGLIPPAMASTEATITAEAVFPSGTKTAQTALPLTIRAIDAPVLTGFSPSIGGTLTTLIISGQNFGVGLRGSIQDVFIGGLPVQSFVVLSPTQIRVIVGQVASGSLTIRTGSGVLTTSASFTFNPLLDAEPVAPSDSLALNALYVATNGALWTTSTNWTNGYPVALRFGVKVERGRVVELVLPVNNLDSTVPWTALANLTALRVLNISGNRLQGALPQNICSMVSLKTLNLSGNRFEGGVEALCCLPAGLENLNISSNQLFGFLPECLGGVGNLQTFDASANRFIGGFPVFLVQLPQLQILNLRGNRLSGILPPSLGVAVLKAAKAKNSALTSVEGLQRLDISGNDFSGNVPAEIGNLSGLRELYMDGNRFTGAVPESFTKLLRLETLNLAGNSFDALPDLANPIPRLVLNVSGNRLPFADLERLAILQNFTYAPQAIMPPRLADTNAVIDAPFALRAAFAGANNRYQWHKNGASVQTISADDALRFVTFSALDSGAYQCTITNTKLPLLTVSTASIRVQAVLPTNVPDSVVLISPVAAEADVPTLPLFVWRSVSGAGQYRVELSASANFSSVLTTLTVVQTSSALASGRMELDSRGLNGFPLQNETRYFWRVRAENALGVGVWASGNFTTAANNTLGAMRLDFGKVPRRDTVFGTLTLRNLSSAPIRLSGDITTSNPAFVCESLNNAEIPAESSLQVRVRFIPSVLEVVNAAVIVHFIASGSTAEQTQTITNRLTGRGGALKLIPPSIDTSVIGTTKLLAVQVVNVGDRITELVSVDLRRGTREYKFRADLSGKTLVGAGDTIAVALRFVAERTGAAQAQEVSCQATTDTATTALVQYGRTKQPTDVVARLGLRAVPESAPPGSEVILELYLEGTTGADREKLLRFGIPSFTAAVRFNRNVLALGSTSVVRPIRNTVPDNAFQSCAIPQTFWNGRDVVLFRIPCRAVAGNTDATALVLEQFQWGDGALQVSDVLEGNFKAITSQAGGKRFISSATAALALVHIAPNPSADVLEVAYTLGSEAWTDISLLDMRGNTVQILAKGIKQAGEQSLQASVKQLPSGTYLLRMESGGAVVMQRVEVVR